MKTIIKHSFFLGGDEIPERPEKGTKCFKCRQVLDDEATVKMASLVVKDDDLIINWNWFCGMCFLEFKNLMEGNHGS